MGSVSFEKSCLKIAISPEFLETITQTIERRVTMLVARGVASGQGISVFYLVLHLRYENF